MTGKSFRVWENLKAFVIIVGFYGVLQLLGITCPIKFITGVSCPGCGMTRAWLSLLFRLDPAAAFSYHPLFWLVVPAAAIYLLRRRIPKRLYSALLLLMVALLVGVYLWRMFFEHGTVVVFAPRDGLIGRVICWLTARLQ